MTQYRGYTHFYFLLPPVVRDTLPPVGPLELLPPPTLGVSPVAVRVAGGCPRAGEESFPLASPVLAFRIII